MKPREIPIGSDIERMSDSALANSPGACVSEWCNYNGLTRAARQCRPRRRLTRARRKCYNAIRRRPRVLVRPASPVACLAGA